MIDDARNVFNDVWNAFPHLRCEAKFEKTHITTAKINRLTVERAIEESGISLNADPIMDFLRTQAPKPDELLGGVIAGETAEVKLAFLPGWKKVRVKGVKPLGSDVIQVSFDPEFS